MQQRSLSRIHRAISEPVSWYVSTRERLRVSCNFSWRLPPV